MPTSFYAANLQWVGLAKEAVYGTPETAPTLFVPVDSPSYKSTITPLKDKNLRGSMAATYEQQQGMRSDELSYKTHFYLDSVYPHFLALLGTPDAVTGSADPYTHTTSLYNGSGTNAAQPPSFTLWWIDGSGKAQRIPGAVISEVNVSHNADEAVVMDVKWTGLPAATVAIPSNTPSAQLPMPSWNSSVTLGGVATSKYSSIELSYKRAVEVIKTITGSQTPFAVFGGPVEVTGSLTGVFQNATSDVDWTNYLANTQPALVLVTSPSGDATHNITLQHSQVAYDITEVSGSDKWMEVKATIEALANATDATNGANSPAKVIAKTAQSTAY